AFSQKLLKDSNSHTLWTADDNPVQVGRKSGVVSEPDGVASSPQWNHQGCAGRNRKTGSTERQLLGRTAIDADRERPGATDQIVNLHPVVAACRHIHVIDGDEVRRAVADKADL